jgi:hypothetical protein
MHPSIRRANEDTYQGQVDFVMVRYLIDQLGSLLRFGGQGLGKACASTEVAKSPHAVLVERASGEVKQDELT